MRVYLLKILKYAFQPHFYVFHRINKLFSCLYEKASYICVTITNNIMKVTKLGIGTYKVVDAQGTWIARGGQATVNGMWTANDCERLEDLSNENNWAVEFKTFAQLKKYSESF